MTKIENLPESLSNWAPTGTGPHNFVAVMPGGSLDLTARSADRIGVDVWAVVLDRAVAAKSVREWAESIARSVSGLRENLRVIEIDATTHEAMLRSVSPSKKGSIASYYEVRLNGTARATVSRFEADTVAGTPRVQVHFPLTHEVLAKLVEDVLA
jgi:hypothetical protein